MEQNCWWKSENDNKQCENGDKQRQGNGMDDSVKMVMENVENKGWWRCENGVEKCQWMMRVLK